MNITSTQQAAIRHLAQSPLAKNFYWTGGTLLAFHYLHHRQSVDIDFFTEQPFTYEIVNDWAQSFKAHAGFLDVKAQKEYDRWEFLFTGKEEVRIEFVLYNHEKKTLRPRKKLLGVFIDSLDDLAANKTMAYIDRSEPKDLFDMYFILTKGKYTAAKLLSLAKEKFGLEIPEGTFWRESNKGYPGLNTLSPLMLEKSKEAKKKLLAKIQAFFEESSDAFLRTQLK